MPEVAVMIEGQDGLNWSRWQRIARVVEETGFVGLFRSDHFTNPTGPVKDALELWVSLTWLASHTRRIEFGPLVSPLSFRHPVITAWMAGAVDDLSGGRLRLGLGAGWEEREHDTFGFPLLALPERFARFQEGLEVITRLLRDDAPVTFHGRYYRLEGAQILPRPARRGGPPIVVGGRGPRRTLPLVARYADEWNAVAIAHAELPALNARLDELLRERGRNPAEVRRSLMATVVFGRDRAELERRLAGRSAAELRARGAFVGTGAEIVEQIQALGRAGLQRVMLQWLDQDDLEGLRALGEAVLSRL